MKKNQIHRPEVLTPKNSQITDKSKIFNFFPLNLGNFSQLKNNGMKWNKEGKLMSAIAYFEFTDLI